MSNFHRENTQGYGPGAEKKKSINSMFLSEPSEKQIELDNLWLKIETKQKRKDEKLKIKKEDLTSVTGVLKSKKGSGFIAIIKFKNKESKNWEQKHLGAFGTFLEACVARYHAQNKVRQGGVMKARRFIESRGYFFFNSPVVPK